MERAAQEVQREFPRLGPRKLKDENTATRAIVSGDRMEIHVTDDAIGRYFRRYQLGLRFVAHGAKAKTTCEWTGLTSDQLLTLCKRWGFDLMKTPRGPAPSSFHDFFDSKKRRAEAALFVSFCRTLGALPARTGKDAAVRLPCIENGERLCEAFEAFREWAPTSTLTFEHAILLARGVVQAELITLAQCPNCDGAMLVGRIERNQETCGLCRRPTAASS